MGNFSLTWDSKTWLKRMHNAIEVWEYRNARQMVFTNTVDIVRAGGYLTEDGEEVALPDSSMLASHSAFFTAEIPMSHHTENYETQYGVANEDCLAFARKMYEREGEVCVLNLANRRNPGGGVENGEGAQEEYLFRCSNYFLSLYQYKASLAESYGLPVSSNQYPMHRNFGGIYSPGVTVFRDTEASGYKLLSKPWQANFIAVAAINSPNTIVRGNEYVMDDYCEGITRNKVRTILRIAKQFNQKVLVLGALGCGIFHNPPGHVSQIFKEILAEEEFQGCFKKVYFAITDKKGAEESNFGCFAAKFGDYVEK